MEVNISARRFWERALRAFKGEEVFPAQIEKDGKIWTLFLFEFKSAV